MRARKANGAGGTSMIIVKRNGATHFTVTFSSGLISDRIILPAEDRCRVKVTRPRATTGFTDKGEGNPYDETFIMLKGDVEITFGQNNSVIVHAGDIVHVPAHTPYAITAITDIEAICFFSPGPDGTLPDNE